MNAIMSQGPLPRAQLEWDEATPTAPAFGDIYFNPDDGLAETRHVFLQGTALIETWGHTKDFTIGELGFGTGLNVLAAWQLWAETKPEGGHLYIISIEAMPLDTNQMERAHAAFPELSSYSAQLRDRLPPRARGHHLVHLAQNVSLHLLYGDAAEMLGQLSAKVDAWFLDGFAPAKNEAMWSADVMHQIARCSSAGARLATFTVAGDVRRALQQVGFEVEKAPGFGRKRHMIKARFGDEVKTRSKTAKWFAPAQPVQPSSVAVIGAGIAGTCLGAALTRAGFVTTLIDADLGPARGASATPAGILIPRLAAEGDANARFYAAAFNHAVRVYEVAGVLSNSGSNGGALRLPRLDEDVPRLDRTKETGLFDPDQLHLLTATEAMEKSGTETTTPALYFERGGAIETAQFLIKAQENLDVRYGRKVHRLVRDDARWLLLDEHDELVLEADAVVVAAGMASLSLLEDLALPLVARMGQLARITNCNANLPIAHGGYVVPQGDGSAWVGTTHDRMDPNDQPRIDPDADQRIIASLARALPDLASESSVVENWSGIRATSPDFVPVAGPVPDRETYLQDFAPLKNGMRHGLPEASYRHGLFALTGLGSRGYVTAPLLAEMIVAQLSGTPLPVDTDVAQILHPGRFLIRGLIKG